MSHAEPAGQPAFDPHGLRIDDFDRPVSLRAVDLETGRPGGYLAFNNAFFSIYDIEDIPDGPDEVLGRSAPDIDAVDQQVIDTATSAEMQVSRFQTLVSLSKNPVIRDGMVVAILTISTDMTDLATTSSQRDLLAVAAEVTDDRLFLYRTTPEGAELVFTNRAAAAFNERLRDSTDPLAVQGVLGLRDALDQVVATATRKESQLNLNHETCLVRDEPLVDDGGRVLGVARTISNISASIEADWTEELLRIATLDDTEQAVGRAFEVGCELLNLPLGVVAELVGDEVVILAQRGLEPLAGQRYPVHKDFRLTLQRDEVWLIRDLKRMRAAGPIVTNSGMGCMAAIPITVDGEKWGLLAFGGFERRKDRFPDRTKPLLEALGGTLSHMIERDVARRKLVPVELLRQSNRELEEYAYAAAHDLRSPLRSMSSFSQLLKQQLSIDPSQTEKLFRYADRIIDGAEQMTGLLQSMLEHAKAGRSTDGDAAIADVGRLVRAIAEAFDEQLRRLDAELTAGPSLPVLAVDSVQLQRVLHNLVDNALKYRHPDRPPRIHVDATNSPDDDSVIMTVTDNGVGVPPEYADQIFGLFKRLTTEGEGTGVGLAVVRRIIEENEGAITVAPGPEDGSVFTITLPRSRLIETAG